MDEEKEVITKLKGQTLQVIFLIVLIIAIAALVYATITVVRYKDIIVNPIGSNLKQFGISYCDCIKNTGDKIFIPATDYQINSTSILS
jgi:hypothetical protein